MNFIVLDLPINREIIQQSKLSDISAAVDILQIIQQQNIHEIVNSNIVLLSNHMKFVDLEINRSHSFHDEDHNFIVVDDDRKFACGRSEGLITYDCVINQNAVSMSIKLDKLNDYNRSVTPIEDSTKVEPSATSQDEDRYSHEVSKAFKWLHDDQRSVSALTICHSLYPETRMNYQIKKLNGLTYTPSDISDFKRCQDFLNGVPGSIFRLKEMAGNHPEWQDFVRRWCDIESLIVNGEAKLANKLINTCNGFS